jgi:hypothetical protein
MIGAEIRGYVIYAQAHVSLGFARILTAENSHERAVLNGFRRGPERDRIENSCTSLNCLSYRPLRRLRAKIQYTFCRNLAIDMVPPKG